MLRRHLGTTRHELRSRPWWEYDLVLEGLREEFSDRDRADPLHIDEDDDELLEEDLDDGGATSLGDLAGTGVQVRKA